MASGVTWPVPSASVRFRGHFSPMTAQAPLPVELAFAADEESGGRRG